MGDLCVCVGGAVNRNVVVEIMQGGELRDKKKGRKQ